MVMNFYQAMAGAMFDFTSLLYVSGVFVAIVALALIKKYDFKTGVLPKDYFEAIIYLTSLGSWASFIYLMVVYVTVTVALYITKRK